MANVKQQTAINKFIKAMKDGRPIDIHMIIHDETEKAYSLLKEWNSIPESLELESIRGKIEEAEKREEDLVRVLMYGSYFGAPSQIPTWQRSLNRLGTLVKHEGRTFLIEFQIYVPLLALYAAGLGSVASGNYHTLHSAFNTFITSKTHGKTLMPLSANCMMLDGGDSNKILGTNNLKTPLSDHLLKYFSKITPDELIYPEDLQHYFDKFEVLLGMFVADTRRGDEMRAWGPVGGFSWRGGFSGEGIMKSIIDEINKEGNDWPPIKAGMFGGDKARALAAAEVIKEISKNISWR